MQKYLRLFKRDEICYRNRFHFFVFPKTKCQQWCLLVQYISSHSNTFSHLYFLYVSTSFASVVVLCVCGVPCLEFPVTIWAYVFVVVVVLSFYYNLNNTVAIAIVVIFLFSFMQYFVVIL